MRKQNNPQTPNPQPNLIPHTPPTPLPPPPNPLTIHIKHIRHRNHQRRKTPRDTAPIIDANTLIQGSHDERQRGGEYAAHKGVCADGGGGVLRKGVDEVVQRGLEDHEEAGAHHEDAEAGEDPVVVWGGGEACEKLAGGEEGAAGGC